MKFRNCFVIAVLLAGAYSINVLADEARPDPSLTPETPDHNHPGKNGAYSFLPWWISRFEFHGGGGPSSLSITNLPDSVRTVKEYNRGIPHTLPDHTSEPMYSTTTLGLGFSLLDANWLEFVFDFTPRNNAYLWDMIGFPSDDFLGYAYNGFSIEPVLKIIPVTYSLGGWEVFQAYFKIGLQKHYDTFSSGTLAWNQYNAQNSLSINGYSHLMGFGFAFAIFYWEYQHSVSYFTQPKMVGSDHYFGLNFSAVARKWCTRFRLTRWFCTVDFG